jgi:hypothetical protein
VLDVQVQNESGCTLSFPYTITLSTRTAAGQLVHQELPGVVTKLPVNAIFPAHTAVAISPAPLPLARIVITPREQPQRTDCPSLVGSWTGSYTIPARAGQHWEEAENGAFSLTVASAGVVEIRAVRYPEIGQVPGLSLHLVGTLTADNEFSGQGLTRVDHEVVDSVQAAGLLKLSSPEPRTGQPRLSVELRVTGAKNPPDGPALQALMTRL